VHQLVDQPRVLLEDLVPDLLGVQLTELGVHEGIILRGLHVELERRGGYHHDVVGTLSAVVVERVVASRR